MFGLIKSGTTSSAREAEVRLREQELEAAVEGVRLAERELKDAKHVLHLDALELAKLNDKRDTTRGAEGSVAYVAPIPIQVYPSIEERRERVYRRQRAESELAVAQERERLARERLADAERVAAPISDAALDRLREVVERIAVDDELRAVSIDIELLLRSPAGREHLRAAAAGYGIISEDA